MCLLDRCLCLNDRLGIDRTLGKNKHKYLTKYFVFVYNIITISKPNFDLEKEIFKLL